MKESDIRKTAVFDEYLRLVEKDIKTFFDFRAFVDVRCPACAGAGFTFEFEKSGFRYVSCKKCSTLFVNPRPGYRALERFYSDSPSARFWANNFFKPVAEARRVKLFRPRARYADGILDKKKRAAIADIGAGFGMFLEELRRVSPDNRYVAIEPSIEMAGICREKGLEVRRSCLEDMKASGPEFDLVTAFELAEHLFDPALFFKKARAALKDKGLVFLTTLNCHGFDIALLWEKSRIVTPPHHLNFFNTVSIRTLLERVGFKIIEISTPGMLDWDIVEGVIKGGGPDLGRFWNLLARDGTEEAKRSFQSWLSRNNLSSHMRVIARKV
ncbi:MAG: methyltransferase domain-containing protein [Candidatus Omnitrophota bacterium]